MQPFNLEEYKKNPTRKICTRDGNIAEIIYTKGKGMFPVIVIDPYEEETEPWQVTENGKFFGNGDDDKQDLFFADDGEELTEYEKDLQIIISEASHWTSDDGSISTYCQFGDKEIKRISAQILDLARKQIEKDIEEGAVEFAKSYMEDVNPSFEKVQESEELWKWKMSCLRGINKAYKRGKQDALKELPRWKRTTDPTRKTRSFLGIGAYELYDGKGFYIELDELEKLPKEE